MKVFEANISHQVSDFLNDNLKKIKSFEKANQKMYDAFGWAVKKNVNLKINYTPFFINNYCAFAIKF